MFCFDCGSKITSTSDLRTRDPATTKVFVKRNGRLKWKPGYELGIKPFLEVFGRSLEVNGHVYFNSTPKILCQLAVEKYARQRHMPSRDAKGKRWNYYELLPKKTAARINKYCELLKKQGIETSAEMISDMTQSPGFGKTSSNVMSLDRRRADL